MVEASIPRTESLGIIVEDHPFDQGYWARFNGQPRDTVKWRGGKAGWDACDREVKNEGRGRRGRSLLSSSPGE